MIKIETLHVEETRGLRHLDLTLDRNNYVVSGPNGSGKSGVVDAIQFALTGEIGRLQGPGTADLSLREHGPHVNARDYPDASFVRLGVFIPSLSKRATITRWVKKPTSPNITPDEPAVRAVFEALTSHRELTLARREIIRFILTEAGDRSRQIQTLLKLDLVDSRRAAFKTAENTLNSEAAAAKAQAFADGESLKRHLDLPELTGTAVLELVNARRTVLGLGPIPELTRGFSLTADLSQVERPEEPARAKESVTRDLRALLDAVKATPDAPAGVAAAAAVAAILQVEADRELLASIQHQPLVELGLSLLDSPRCPLCDKEWDVAALKEHLQQKLARAKRAEEFRTELLRHGETLAAELTRTRGLIGLVTKVPEVDQGTLQQLGGWSADLDAISKQLVTVDNLLLTRPRLESGLLAAPAGLERELESALERVAARPDKSAAGQARDFLVVTQERLAVHQASRRREEEKRAAAARGALAYKTYCDVAEGALAGLYSTVEKELSELYQFLNRDDEGEFCAKLVPAQGKLGLLVDFYKKGMFPPGAFHSEGHQDGMGVCLYLALLRQVLGTGFTFAVLDDVVMSVDRQHRRRFCTLLKKYFPETQFIITTHDEVWARQMRTEGLVRKRNSVAFSSWTVESGPVIAEVPDIWEKVASDLASGDVPGAAFHLRRHLEFVSADLADLLGAKVPFRADGAYDLGDLLSGVIGRQGELLGRAKKAAQSWKNSDDEERVDRLLAERARINSTKNGEQWAINKAIHFNEWETLSPEEFEPVVGVFRQLLDQFRCSNPACGSWAAVTSRIDPAELRCDCGLLHLNLKEK